MCAQAGGGPQRNAPRLIQLASATEAEGASRWQLQQGELDSFGSAMKHAAETHLLRSAITSGDQAVEFLLQFAEKSEDNPFAQEAALQLLAKTHDSNTTQNQRETGHYIFIEWPQIASGYTNEMKRLTITDNLGIRSIEF